MATYLNIMIIHSKKKYMFTSAHMCCIYVGLDRRNLNHVIMFITIYSCIILFPANIFNNKTLMSRGSCIVVLAREDKKTT